MRWSIIRLIWFRELRDQLRDRRTVFMMVVLPLLLYPALGFGVVQFALGFMGKTSTVGVYGGEDLAAKPGTPGHALPAGANPLPAVAWLTAAPAPAGPGIGRLAGAAALSQAASLGLGQDYPPLFVERDGVLRFAPGCFDSVEEANALQVKLLGPAPAGNPLAAVDRALLENRQADLLLIVPAGFRAALDADGRPGLYVISREGDDRSRLVSNRAHLALARWKKRVKELRLLRHGLPANFDDPFEVKDPERAKPLAKRAAEDLFDMLLKVFPFVLVMWSLAGALYPAVDLCAGEKERGTMETLLISPAGREEIVLGKFLTIWVFSAATALLNLASMGFTATQFAGMVPQAIFRPAALVWCVVLVLPLSAFFSALCLAVGAYARSSKEGQYYLLPLFLLTMPLILLTLAPGVELNPFYSLVPVTGVALLLQKLLAAGATEQVPWLYFVPVLAPMVIYGWLALRWAAEQFKREDVLFREAERLDLGLWLRRLFREKEPAASAGQAFFCFALIVGLNWAALGLGGGLPLLVRGGVGLLAFVAAPALFMALLLTTRPREALGLARPSARSLAAAALLAFLLLPPLSELTVYVLRQFPGLMDLLAEQNALTGELRALGGGEGPLAPGPWLRESGWQLLLGLVVLPAVCEELTFRGFILGGLRRRFGPWGAVGLSSFLFALYHFNVFQFLPAFVLGAVLALVTLRSGSVVPAMLFHLLHNGLLVGLVVLQRAGFGGDGVAGGAALRPPVALGCALAAGWLLWRLTRLPAPALAVRAVWKS